MDKDSIASIFDGISDEWRQILGRDLRVELSGAINRINNQLQIDGKRLNDICPQPRLIFNAFRLCPFDGIKFVLIGQDPYINQQEAMGLSFSVPDGIKVPPSLRAIYGCLIGCGLMKDMPASGNLTNWAQQGGLLINASMTTYVGKSNAHTGCWDDYTDKIIKKLSDQREGLVFILLGGFARKKKDLIDIGKHLVLEWGHPSPLNAANKSDNPANFKYADVFIKTNQHLILRGLTPINWEIIPIQPNQDTNMIIKRLAGPLDPPPADGIVYIFTDGGSSGNGKKSCRSSWGYYITDGYTIVESYGIVPEKEIEGEKFMSSNNRGELTAIANALSALRIHASEYTGKVIIVSDSAYSIGAIGPWSDAWLADMNKLKGKKNLDIIIPIKEDLAALRECFGVEFLHTRSHQVEPTDKDSQEWFIWRGNDIVDKFCSMALLREKK